MYYISMLDWHRIKDVLFCITRRLTATTRSIFEVFVDGLLIVTSVAVPSPNLNPNPNPAHRGPPSQAVAEALDLGADVYARDKAGATPLLTAAALVSTHACA